MDIYTILGTISLVLLAAYIVGFIRVWLYERQINEISDKRDTEIERIKNGGGRTISFIEGSIKTEKEKVQAKIDELERKRRFILDKLPLMRK